MEKNDKKMIDYSVDGEPCTLRDVSTVRRGVCANLPKQFGKAVLSYSTNQNYGELPIHIALRRHLYDSHVHTNSQALNRPWDKIREQQGCFIHALGVMDYGDFLIVKAISYTKYESALECLPPPEKPDKYYTMKYGEILEHKFKVPINSLTYDTRHFRTQLLNTSKGVENENTRAAIII